MRFDQEIVDAGNVQPVPVIAGNTATPGTNAIAQPEHQVLDPHAAMNRLARPRSGSARQVSARTPIGSAHWQPDPDVRAEQDCGLLRRSADLSVLNGLRRRTSAICPARRPIEIRRFYRSMQ